MCLYFEVMCCESVGWCVGVPLGLLPQLFPSTLHCDLSHVVPTQNHIIIVIFIAAIIIIIISSSFSSCHLSRVVPAQNHKSQCVWCLEQITANFNIKCEASHN